jgi:hypothetical protein
MAHILGQYQKDTVHPYKKRRRVHLYVPTQTGYPSIKTAALLLRAAFFLKYMKYKDMNKELRQVYREAFGYAVQVSKELTRDNRNGTKNPKFKDPELLITTVENDNC